MANVEIEKRNRTTGHVVRKKRNNVTNTEINKKTRLFFVHDL